MVDAVRARARVFELADLDDDGGIGVRVAWRAAAHLHHPDKAGDPAVMREHLALKKVLEPTTAWRTARTTEDDMATNPATGVPSLPVPDFRR